MSSRVEVMERTHAQIQSRVLVVEDSKNRTEDLFGINSDALKSASKSIHSLSSKVKEMQQRLAEVCDRQAQNATAINLQDCELKIEEINTEIQAIHREMADAKTQLRKLAKVARRELLESERQNTPPAPARAGSRSRMSADDNCGSSRETKIPLSVLELKEEKRKLSQQLRANEQFI